MKPSAIPAVQVAIRATLDGAAGLEGVAIADEREPINQKEYIWIYPGGKAKRDWKGIGRKPALLEEKISVRLRVVVIGGEDPKLRAFEIAGAAEEALRENRSLDGCASKHLVEELDQELQDFDGKTGCHVWMTVVAETRI
jgi:hypothetical protein